MFHYLTNIPKYVSSKSYSKLLLINQQPNAILKFYSIDIYYWCKADGNTVSDMSTKSLASYLMNICALTFNPSAGSFFVDFANY